MVISIYKKINLIWIAWGCIPRVPLKTKLQLFIKPLESTRYTEITYIFYFIKSNLLDLSLCLDVSSPYILAYILSKKNRVIKTDIFPDERRFITESDNLKFEIQDALALKYKDNVFSFVYSISAIEHIYKGLHKSVNEMVRVTKPGGHIYISFPVSAKYQEEWLDNKIYSDQYVNNNKTFFQYRLDNILLESFLNKLDNVSVIEKKIYWEKKNGNYNKMISKLRNTCGISAIDYLKNALINLYYGFSLLKSSPENFKKAKDYGNLSIILKKIK
ncbi:MAG: hypothetical protein CO128_04685 [Ignavibacteriales bacterium CG_4_9_14_3_um_filter_30_11]|nr:MAG: hypothetical protein CO128_04685 [Ignavibacteriales bacterium CG_4_9_14_3_um_filter_30_11]